MHGVATLGWLGVVVPHASLFDGRSELVRWDFGCCNANAMLGVAYAVKRRVQFAFYKCLPGLFTETQDLRPQVLIFTTPEVVEVLKPH